MRYTTLAAIYIAAAFLTGGYYSNHRCDSPPYTQTQCFLQSALTGAFWPAYWGGRAAIEVTK